MKLGELVIKHVLLIKQKILPLMKLGELYVHIYY